MLKVAQVCICIKSEQVSHFDIYFSAPSRGTKRSTPADSEINIGLCLLLLYQPFLDLDLYVIQINQDRLQRGQEGTYQSETTIIKILLSTWKMAWIADVLLVQKSMMQMSLEQNFLNY